MVIIILRIIIAPISRGLRPRKEKEKKKLSLGILRFRNPAGAHKKRLPRCSVPIHVSWLHAHKLVIVQLTSMDNRLPSDSDPLSMVNGGPVRTNSNWVVQKFGGTSVGKFALNIIDQVVLWVLQTWSFNIVMVSPADDYVSCFLLQTKSFRTQSGPGLFCKKQFYQSRRYHEPVSHILYRNSRRRQHLLPLIKGPCLRIYPFLWTHK